MIAAALADAGAEVDVLPVVEDDTDAHRTAIARGLDADVLVTSGGVSMGPHDLVRRIAAELGVEEIFWGVAVKPGKPLVLRGSRRDARLRIAGESGVVARRSSRLRSAGVSSRDRGSRARLRPSRAPGSQARFAETRTATSSCARSASRRPTAPLLEAIVGQESHMIARAAAADALIHVPRGDGELPEGASVRYLALD